MSVYVVGAVFCDACRNFVLVPLVCEPDGDDLDCVPACELPGWEMTPRSSRCKACVDAEREVDLNRPDPRPIGAGWSGKAV